MNNLLIIALIVSILFFIIKMIELKSIEKESKPLKFLVKDTIIVYISVVIGYFIMEQLQPLIMEGGLNNYSPNVFTNNPSF